MKIAVIAVALLGFATGLVFRLNVLIAVLVFLLLFSIGYGIAGHLGFLTSILFVVFVQVIAQTGYFLGLVARSMAGRARN